MGDDMVLLKKNHSDCFIESQLQEGHRVEAIGIIQ